MVRRTRPNKGGRIAGSCVQKTPGGTPFAYQVLHTSRRFGPRRRALATVADEIKPVMHGPILLALITGLGVAGVVLARLPDRLRHRPTRARPRRAGPHHPVPPGRDAGGAAAEA